MANKRKFIELEQFLKKNYIPDLSHHVYESLYHPENQYLQVKRGEAVIRTIREEDSDILYYQGITTLNALAEEVLVRERKR